MSTRPHPSCSAVLAAALALGATAPLNAQTEPDPEGISRARPGAPVTLNFVNAEIESVSRAIAAMLNRPIVVDPRVRGQISVTTDKPQPPAEAYRTFLAQLRGLGFTVVENAGLLKVVPESDAKVQTGIVSVGPSSVRGDQIITQIFQLRYENPNNLVGVLRPLITANNTINANPNSNSLIITDYADNLQRLGKIIAALDVPSTSDFDIIPLEHAVAADVAALVQRLAETGPVTPVPGGAPAANAATQVVADPRSNSLIVRAANPGRLAAARSIIAKIDRPTPSGGPAGSIWVVYLKHADATKMAEVLRATMGSSGGGGSSSGSSLSSTPSTPSAMPATAGGPQGAAGGTGSSQASTPTAASPRPSTGGQIQADPSTNSLIITAPEPLYRQLRAVIDQLDSRRAQIYIESMVVELTGGDAADAGFQWQGLIGKDGDKTIPFGGTNFGTTGNILGITGSILGIETGGGGTTGGSSGSAASAVGQGMTLGVLRDFGGTYSLAAVARLLQSQTSTNIISTPNLITLDNEEAKIVVGQNVPFVTGQFTSTGTGTTNPFQTIERKDVGLTLRIRPQVGEGGVVRMKIYQESSSVSNEVAPGTTNAGPSTNTRSIDSMVTVDDGQIIVLGGLIEDRYETTKNKVPLLGDIPIAGALFRSESRTKRRTNLMVFLRPIVLRDGAAQDKLTMDRYDLIRAQQLGAQPAPNMLLPISDAPVVPALPASGTPAGSPPAPLAPARPRGAGDAPGADTPKAP